MKTLAKIGALALAAVAGYFVVGMVLGTVIWLVKVAVVVGIAFGAWRLWCWAKGRSPS